MTYDPRRQMGCQDDDSCEGGYRRVTDRYVDEVAPLRPDPHPDLGPRPGEDAEAARALWDERDRANRQHRIRQSSARAAAANTVFPCPKCNPEQFIRWEQGDWPYPARTRSGSTPVPNSDPGAPPVPDDDDLFASLAVPYGRGDEDF